MKILADDEFPGAVYILGKGVQWRGESLAKLVARRAGMRVEPGDTVIHRNGNQRDCRSRNLIVAKPVTVWQ